MNHMLWEAFGAMALACMAAGYLTGLLHEAARRDRAEYDAQIGAYEDQIEANRHGRHERTAPRRTPQTALVRDAPSSTARPAPRPQIQDAEPSSWYRTIPPRPAFTPRRGLNHTVTTAADIDLVMLPEPGTRYPARLRPQPGRDSGTGTTLMPPVRLRTGDTGEIRAIGNAAVAAIEAAGTALREWEAVDDRG